MIDPVGEALAVLRDGGLVAVPTETVYGLAADASNESAVRRIFAVKGRPVDHPLIVHIATAEHLGEWAASVPPAAAVLADACWPGPLTLLVPRAARVLDAVTGGRDSVGIRVPAHRLTTELLTRFGGGLAAPSANRFGRVSPTTAAHVRADLGSDVDLVLEGGASEVGIESTIVDLSRGAPVLLRPGRISQQELEAALGAPVALRDREAPKHPGGLESHYAPLTPVRLVPPHALDAEIARLGARAAVLAFSRPDERVDYWLRMPRDAEGYARRLYGALRELDEARCDAILVEAPPTEPAWHAVLDRLRRAASGG